MHFVDQYVYIPFVLSDLLFSTRICAALIVLSASTHLMPSFSLKDARRS